MCVFFVKPSPPESCPTNPPPPPKMGHFLTHIRCGKVRGFLMHNAKAGSIRWRGRPYVAHPPWSHCQRWIGKPWRLWLPEMWTWRWAWGICPALESLSAVLKLFVGQDVMNIYESWRCACLIVKVRTVESKESFLFSKNCEIQKHTVNQKCLNHKS